MKYYLNNIKMKTILKLKYEANINKVYIKIKRRNLQNLFPLTLTLEKLKIIYLPPNLINVTKLL